MKRIILSSIVIIASVFFAASCTNEKIDIKKQITITISPASVLSGFTPYDSGDLDMYSDEDCTAELRLTTLIYDESGNLFYEDEGLVSDYNQTYSFKAAFPNYRQFKIVSFCSSIIGSLSKPEYESYSISGKSNLESLKIIKDDDLKSWYSNYHALGYGVSDYSTSSSADVLINLKPCVSYVTFHWMDIHAHDGETTTTKSFYGDFTASTKDYWGKNSYNWTITIEKDGNSTTDVIVKNLDPAFVEVGLTADKGYNTFYGTINGSTICIPRGQKTGLVDEGDDVLLQGVSKIEGESLYFGDIFIDMIGGVIQIRNNFGTCTLKGDGWASLYDSGIVLTPTSAGGIDQYRLIYHGNDVVTYDGFSLAFSTTLDAMHNFGNGVEPAIYKDAKNIYSCDFLLPGTFNTFGRTFVGSEMTDYSKREVTIEMGKQYVFEFDCKNLKTNFRTGTLLTKSGGDILFSKQNDHQRPLRKYFPKHIVFPEN